MKTVIFSGLVYMITFLGSCIKEPLNGYYHLNPELKAYNYFKKGSWWVYKQEGAGIRDSVYVTLDTTLYDQSNHMLAYSRDKFIMNLKSTYDPIDTLVINGDVLANTTNEYKYDLSSISFLYARSYHSTVAGYFTDGIVGDTMKAGTTTPFAVYEQELPIITISGNSFADVKIFKALTIPSTLKLPRKVWYAKNIGIIKKELFNGEVWNIENYFIRQ